MSIASISSANTAVLDQINQSQIMDQFDQDQEMAQIISQQQISDDFAAYQNDAALNVQVDSQVTQQ